MTTKVCTKCLNDRPLVMFSKMSQNLIDGLAYHCKECAKEYAKKYREKNSKRIAEVKKAWAVANKEHLAEYHKKWSAENGEYRRIYDSAYYLDRSEEIKRRTSEYYKRHKMEMCEAGRLWREANPEKVRASRVNRKARVRDADGSHTGGDIADLIKLQKGKCAVCSVDVSKSYHVDHIYPLVKGGTNDRGNLQILCPGCNLQKHSKDPILFMQSKGKLI